MGGLYSQGPYHGCMAVHSKGSGLNPMRSLKCGVLSVQCLVCKVNLQCAVYSVQCTLSSMQWEVCSVQFEVCSVQCAAKNNLWLH